MKKTATILALAMGAAIANAGTTYTGTTTPAPDPVDRCAGPISYNNIELLYANTDWGSGIDDADGGILRGEYSPIENFYITASAEYQDFGDSDFGFGLDDQWIFTVGLGGYFPLTENIQIAADAGYLYIDAEFEDGASDSEDGWYGRPHLRAKWGCFTAKAGGVYRDLGDDFDGGEWSWFLQAYYSLNQNWDITAGYEDGDQFEQITAGVRWRF